MQATQCPTRAELAEYLLGTAPESRLSELANHIDTCADCATTVERLENKKDSFLQALRGLAQEGELGEDPALQRAIDGAKQVACEAAQGRPKATTAAFVDAPESDPGAGPLPEVAGYKLVAELGHGGMGTVYKAIQPHLERHVAIKLVKKDLTKESQAVSRFQREMKAVGLLDHVNIVRALHAGQEADQHFLVMEMVDGLSLSQLVQRVGPLPTADACELIRQAALGLQHAFEHGLVHRDVKPSNLMLDRRGQVKVLDLGLARLHPALVPGEEATSAGQLMGTADYMAPEQASDSHQVDIRADIYSLGCTLFELLVGRAPFRGPRYPNIMAKILAHSQQPVPDIRGERGDIPEALFQVLQRMLAKDAKERYTVPSEVATALEPLVIGCDLPGLLQRAHQVTASHAPADPSLDSTDAVAKSRSGTDAGRQAGTARLPTSRRLRPKQLFIALGLLPLLVLAGVVIWINKTRIEVPDGSDVRVNPDGSVAVNTPHGNVARAPSGTAGRSDADERPLVLRPPTSPSLAIPPEPIDLPAGAPLSPLALVQRPAAIPGVQSWTIETRGHRGGVTVLAASPDGQWVASGSTDGSVRLWDPGRKKLARVLLGHPFEIRAFAWSPDSRILASTCGGIVRFWDVASGRVLRTMTGGGLDVLAWNPDGTSYAVGVYDQACTTKLSFHEAKTGRVQRSFDLVYQSGQGCADISWSPDGQRIALGIAGRHAVEIRDATTGKILHEFRGGAERVNFTRVVWSPDGKYIACCNQFTVEVWDAVTGAQVNNVKGLASALAWSPDSKRLALAEWDVILGIRDSEPSIRLPNTGNHAVAWCPDGNTVVLGNQQGDVQFCEPFGTVAPLVPEQGQYACRMYPLAWAPDESAIAFYRDRSYGNELRSVGLWSRREARLVANIQRLPVTPGAASWSPDGKTIAIASDDGTIRRWDSQSGAAAASDIKTPSAPYVVAWSPDGLTLASAHRDSTVRLWDAGTGELRHCLNVPAGGRELVWSPDSRHLITTGPSEIGVQIWEAKTGQMLRTLADAAGGACWSSDCKRLATFDKEVQVWNTASWERTAKYPLRTSTFARMSSWLPDGKTLVVLDAGTVLNGGPRLMHWNTATDELVAERPGPYTWGLPFVVGSQVMACEWTNAAYFWDVASVDPRGTLVLLHDNKAVAISPQGHYCCSGLDADKELIYVVQTDEGQSILAADAFAEKFKWSNDPARVRWGTATTDGAEDRKPDDVAPPSVASPLPMQPEAPNLPPGAPLSPLALVQRPAAIPGVQSWTIETRGHRGGVIALAASPDGRWVASGSADGTIRLWDTVGKKLVRVFMGHQFGVRTLAWSPDSRILASTCGSSVRFWDVATGYAVRILTGEAFPLLAWNPDGTSYAIGAPEKLSFHDVKTGREQRSFSLSRNSCSVAWSPDGQRLAAGIAWKHAVEIRDAATGAILHELNGESENPHYTRVVWSPDSKYVASCNGGTVEVWDAEAGTQINKLKGWAEGLAWSPDSRSLAIVGFNFYNAIWEITKAQAEIRLPSDHDGAVAWCPDGKTIVIGGPEGHVRFCEPSQPNSLSVEPGQYYYRMRSLAWSPDESTLAFFRDRSYGDEVRSVGLWDTRAGQLLANVQRLPVTPLSATWSPDGKTLAIANEDGTIRRWDVQRDEPVGSDIKVQVPASVLAWSPDGTTLASGHAGDPDSTARLWDANTGELLQTVTVPAVRIDRLVWSHDSRQLVTQGPGEAGVQIWDATTGQLLRKLADAIGGASWSLDGRMLATFGGPGVQVWDAAGWQLRSKYQLRAARWGNVWGVLASWKPDGKTLVVLGSGHADSQLRQWDTATDQLVSDSLGPYSQEDSFVAGKRTMASHWTNAAHLWEITTGEPRGTLVLLRENKTLAISPEGHYRGSGLDLERELVYVVQTDKGQSFLSPDEFAVQYGWKNASEQVRLVPSE